MASSAVEVLDGWALSPQLADLPRRLRLLGLRSVQVLEDLMGTTPLEFFGEVLGVEGFAAEDETVLENFARVIVLRASLERQATQSETHLDVVVECLKRKATVETPNVTVVGPLPGLRSAAAFRRMGPRGKESMAEKDRRAKSKWADRFKGILVRAEAPVLEGLDAEDQNEYIMMLLGKARPGTVRIRVHTWEVYLRWLETRSDKKWPEDVRDLIDYVRAMVNVPAAAYFPKVFASAVHWFGGRAGFVNLEGAGADPRFKRAIEWAELELASETLQKRKAPRVPVMVLVAMEVKVLDEGAPMAVRVTAWYRLVKVYGGLRWDDLQRLIPKHVEMKEVGLVGRMVRTKVSGPGRKVKELPLFVSRDADLTGGGWLQAGYDIWKTTVGEERDYFIPRPTADMSGYTDKVATEVDAMIMGQAMFASLEVPVMTDETKKVWGSKGDLFLKGALADAFTNHSERATLVSALAAIGIDKERRSMVGRWSADGSDEYVRTYRAVLRDLSARFVAAVRSGNSYLALDEEDAYDQMGVWLINHNLEKESVDLAIAEVKELARRASTQWAAEPEKATPTEVASLTPIELDFEEDGEVKDYKYLIVYTRGRRCARLHSAGGCWRARQMMFKDAELIEDHPDRTSYNRVCKECWPGQPTVPSEGWLQEQSDEEESGSSTSSAAGGEAADC